MYVGQAVLLNKIKLPSLWPRKGKRSEVAQSCPTLCNPMDCSLPGFSVHGIFQAIVMEWIAKGKWLVNIFSFQHKTIKEYL